MGWLAVHDVVRKRQKARLRVEDPDVDRPGREHRPDPLADELDDRLEVELARERLADLVDDRQLARPLVGFGQQPLRFAEQAGVLERHAHAGCEGGEQPLVGLAEGACAETLESDDTDDPVAGRDRGAQP